MQPIKRYERPPLVFLVLVDSMASIWSLGRFLVRFTVLEVVNDSDIPTEPLPLSCCGSACWYRAESTPVESYDGQICVVGAQREDSPQASSQSVGKMDPRAPVWARRYVRNQDIQSKKLVVQVGFSDCGHICDWLQISRVQSRKNSRRLWPLRDLVMCKLKIGRFY